MWPFSSDWALQYLECLFVSGSNFCSTIQLCQQAALFKARPFFFNLQVLWVLHLTLRSHKKKEKIAVLSYQRHPSFTGKNNSDLIISVKHVPAGPCGQTSSVHKWQNNGERNYKTLSSRAIKSSTRIWDVSSLLGEGSIIPLNVVLRPCASHWHRKELVRRAMLVIGSVNLSPCSVLLLYMDSNKSYMMTNFLKGRHLYLLPPTSNSTLLLFFILDQSEWLSVEMNHRARDLAKVYKRTQCFWEDGIERQEAPTKGRFGSKGPLHSP